LCLKAAERLADGRLAHAHLLRQILLLNLRPLGEGVRRNCLNQMAVDLVAEPGGHDSREGPGLAAYASVLDNHRFCATLSAKDIEYYIRNMKLHTSRNAKRCR